MHSILIPKVTSPGARPHGPGAPQARPRRASGTAQARLRHGPGAPQAWPDRALARPGRTDFPPFKFTIGAAFGA
eukprot:gene16190-biopygen23249